MLTETAESGQRRALKNKKKKEGSAESGIPG